MRDAFETLLFAGVHVQYDPARRLLAATGRCSRPTARVAARVVNDTLRAAVFPHRMVVLRASCVRSNNTLELHVQFQLHRHAPRFVPPPVPTTEEATARWGAAPAIQADFDDLQKAEAAFAIYATSRVAIALGDRVAWSWRVRAHHVRLYGQLPTGSEVVLFERGVKPAQIALALDRARGADFHVVVEASGAVLALECVQK